MPWDLPAETVLPLLELGDRRWAMDARVAWDWLTASGDSPVVGLHDLEYFLWYQLPAKFLTDLEEHRKVALALAELLGELGYEDAAAVCRAPVTMRVLQEWDRDRSAGHRALRKALEESGVEPPDSELLAWGEVMGVTEAAVYQSAANWLERAISEGELTPGTRGWRAAQDEVVRRYLTTPFHSLDERTPQAAVWAERQQLWAEPPGRPLRKAFLKDVRDIVRLPPAAPAALSDGLLPLVRLLELIAIKPTLTQAGYLPPSTVRTLTKELGWWHWQGEPRSEADVPQMLTLRELAKDAGLIRRSQGRLVLTDAGHRAQTDNSVLWVQVTRTLARGEDFASALRELLLVQLLQGPVQRGQIEANVAPILSEMGWKPSDGRALDADMVSFRFWDAMQPFDILGMVEKGTSPDRGVSLTDIGEQAAKTILWLRSIAPRRSVW